MSISGTNRPDSTTGGEKLSNPYRIMVVDDSAVVRGLVTRMIEAESDFHVIVSVGNGKMAVEALDRKDVEVVILDIEMPVMDGLTALPELLSRDRDLKIIMASTLTMQNADISMRALQAGASDYIPKPTSSRELGGGQDFGHDLVQKIRSLGATRRKKKGEKEPGEGGGKTAQTAPVARPKPPLPPRKPVTLRTAPKTAQAAEILAIGSSTGGPQALFTVLKGLKGKIDVPIIITQHMPATFTTILAEHITRMSGWEASEAKDGDVLTKGHVYVAPGDYHMILKVEGVQKVLRLNQDPPENFCRPAVDPMFRSVADIYGARAYTLILTGMGSDGLKGSRVIVEKGGVLVAQDEETSVVWGMPGAVAQDGICSAVLPLEEIAGHIAKTMSRTV